MDQKIDFVLIWVDGSDQKWLESKKQYSPTVSEDDGAHRYRDWDLLKYWFRGVEKYAPWVNNIFFITCGHYPSWLDLNHPKLKFIKHSDYIPKEYLPTFSSHPIELNLHRIKDLSEHFVYFNDDMFIVNNVKPSTFFSNGLPCDSPTMNLLKIREDYHFPHILLNNIFLFSKDFDKHKIIKSDLTKWFNLKYGVKNNLRNILFYFLGGKYFTGFRNEHLPAPFLKNTLVEAWERFGTTLDQTSKNKFRSIEDVSQYVFRYLQFVSGKFYPTRIDKIGIKFSMPNNLNDLLKIFERGKLKLVCVNDDSTEMDFEDVRKSVVTAFEQRLPDKCSFEL